MEVATLTNPRMLGSALFHEMGYDPPARMPIAGSEAWPTGLLSEEVILDAHDGIPARLSRGGLSAKGLPILLGADKSRRVVSVT